MVAAVSTDPLFSALIDDAAMFPPANAPPADALAAHATHKSSGHASFVGPFLVSDRNLADLGSTLEAETDLGLVVTGGAGAIGPAIVHAGRIENARLIALEIALRDEDDLGRNAERIVTMLDLELPDDATASIEMPRLGDNPPTGSWWDAADVLAASGHRLKFRTGGEWADSHPSEPELAAFIAAALDRECPFKLTAGLHRAIRHTTPEGFEQHGFLNVMLATQVLLAGAITADATYALVRRDAAGVAADIASWDSATCAKVRSWFTSFGSCSIDEPLTDLIDLELIT